MSRCYSTENETLKKELEKCHIDLLAESQRINVAEREIYVAQSDRDQFNAQVIKLKAEISRLKLKCGEERKFFFSLVQLHTKRLN